MLHKIEQKLAFWGQVSQIEYHEERLVMLKALAHRLGILEWTVPVISITGTNGKGSTVASLRHIYQAAGFKVGVFTSPHLLDIRERIAINQDMIDEVSFLDILQNLQHIPECAQLSYFEVLTFVALIYFKAQNVDVLILEVGMGGRLDAVNMIDADLVVVTNIDLDHQAYLGETREDIAYEKAGLFRAYQHVVYADEEPCPQRMMLIAQQFKTDFYRLNWEYGLQDYGESQVHPHSISAAIQAAKILSSRLPVHESHFEWAVKHCAVPGRQQMISVEPSILLDVSHNPHGAKYLVNTLAPYEKRGRIHIVFSILKDKDAQAIVEIVNNLNPLWYNCVLHVDRSQTIEGMQHIMRHQVHPVGLYHEPTDAFQAARDAAQPNDTIVVFGSFYLVEQIMRLLQRENVNVI
jgi:dihydrofolate synthase/folylpolyglutamate synthase